MRITVERLRTGLLVGAGLLVLVIAGFLGYARYKVHRALVALPGRLGATITKEFNGWTYSQSDGKKTIFTIHASKAVQHTDGTLTLHDVSMILYGHTGDRADRISGDEFEYDTKAELIRAVGIVHLDLEAPVAAGERTSDAAKHLGGPRAGFQAVHQDGGEGSKVIHVKTSGLVYMKKLGVASTVEAIEFGFGGFTGHAMGAEYDSGTGRLVLQSAITVSGLDARQKGGDKPVAMAASHGELDRQNEVAVFQGAHYSSAGEMAQAELVKIHMRPDGTMERIEGERRVVLETPGQGSVTSERADVAVDTNSKPTTAVLAGSVHFAEDEPLRQARGDSDRADIEFDGQGHIRHAVLLGRVRTSERLRNVGASGPSERTLAADALELSLAADGMQGKPQLREAKASGSARLNSVAPDAKGGTVSTKVTGDTLVAHLISRNGAAELSTVHGSGHTAVEQTSAAGIDQKSTGDALDATFQANAKGKGAVDLATAVQQGNVVVDRTVPAQQIASSSGVAEVQHATATNVAFYADTDRLTLSGDVRLHDAESEVAAGRIVMQQDSGDATADGTVKVSYLQAGAGEPVHVLAARAELNHGSGRATFYGSIATGTTAGLRSISGGSAGGGRPARMWQAGTGGQGGSQVEAPVLVFEREQKRLTARSETAGVANTVHAVLASAASGRDATVNGAKDATKPLRQGVARITSSLMVYSDVERQAEFSGGVEVMDASGEMRAQEATVFLAVSGAQEKSPQGAATKRPAGLTGLFGGSVERIVARQRIEIMQPGRKATGERLIYTASDQMFVLTGTVATPAKVVDQTQGTTTGAALRFHSGDDSVMISGANGESPTRRVRTETQVQSGTRVKQK